VSGFLLQSPFVVGSEIWHFGGHCSWAVNGENHLATAVNEWNQSRDVFLRD